jgi:hypothetical protein
MSPAITTRVLLVVALFLTLGLGLMFWRGQRRRAAMGGAISIPKMLWLAYAVGLWLFIVPVVALDSGVHPSLRVSLGAFSVLMWIRAPIEMVMLYVTKNWRPPYGIAHCSLCLVVMATTLLRVPWTQLGGYDHWVVGFTAMAMLSLVTEVVYAVRFHGAVQGKTTGDEGVWFANSDDPSFVAINQLTARMNVVLFGLLACFLLRSLLG